MRLTNEEYNIVEKLARRSKCDCWFELGVDEFNEDIVVDLEEDTTKPLDAGLLELDDCLTDLSDYDISKEEKDTYKSIIKRMRVSVNIDKQRLIVLLSNALTLIECGELCGKTLKGTELQDELNITDDEYDYIMNGD